MKKFLFLSILLLLSCLIMPFALASDDDYRVDRFTDKVGLLSSRQEAELIELFNGISLRQQFDVVAAVVYSLDGKNPRLYAADYFEQQGFGTLDNTGGIILLIAMEERDFAFVTTGHGLSVFTDTVQEYLENLFLPYLRVDDYFAAFTAFAEGSEYFLEEYSSGGSLPADNLPIPPGMDAPPFYPTNPDSSLTAEERRNLHIGAAVVSLVLAFAIPGIVVAVWTRQLKSVRPKDTACDYIRRGSMSLNVQRDIFLYRNVRRTAKSQNSSSGGGSSGGFKSSSGGSFSGRSGKF
ncbi:MAG: TPM domain-containing protein [Oscillospiraceae bacterium]|nr:TPM domain-containing protein [Oscillospiraceae bacterium]